MTIELRKFHLIEAIMSIRDETLIKQFEEMLRKARIESYEASLKPMTPSQLKARAMASEEDIKAGRVYDLEEWQKEIEKPGS